MLMAVELVTAFGAISTALATLAGGYAVLQAKNTERKSASREEMKQAFDAQDLILNRYEKDNSRLRARVDELHEKLNTALGEVLVARRHQQDCEQRLTAAEARISELGG